MKYEAYGVQETVDIIEVGSFRQIHINTIRDDAGELLALDIRNWYCTQQSPEFKPTQKGVRIDASKLHQLKSVLESLGV